MRRYQLAITISVFFLLIIGGYIWSVFYYKTSHPQQTQQPIMQPTTIPGTAVPVRTAGALAIAAVYARETETAQDAERYRAEQSTAAAEAGARYQATQQVLCTKPVMVVDSFDLRTRAVYIDAPTSWVSNSDSDETFLPEGSEVVLYQGELYIYADTCGPVLQQRLTGRSLDSLVKRGVIAVIH